MRVFDAVKQRLGRARPGGGGQINGPARQAQQRAGPGHGMGQPLPALEPLEPRMLLSVDGLMPGDLDPTFGDAGIVTTDFLGPQGDMARAVVAVQADGKIVVAGYSTQRSTGEDFALARYNADGSLDREFGGKGK